MTHHRNQKEKLNLNIQKSSMASIRKISVDDGN